MDFIFGGLNLPKIYKFRRIKSAEIREPYFTEKKFYSEKNNSYSNWSTMNDKNLLILNASTFVNHHQKIKKSSRKHPHWHI